jgi:acetolactate synthase I/III small subunit
VSIHTLSVLVENKPGVLARVSGLFRRRAWNIESLSVAPTANPAFSRMTIMVDASDQPFEQLARQLDKLVNVLEIVELPAPPPISPAHTEPEPAPPAAAAAPTDQRR